MEGASAPLSDCIRRGQDAMTTVARSADYSGLSSSVLW